MESILKSEPRKRGRPFKYEDGHSLSLSPEYKTWSTMKKRCLDESRLEYCWYGARGITICDEWSKSFLAFLRDMGNRPSASHTLDRIDNSKGYAKENCRWATKREQNKNRRNAILYEYEGKKYMLCELCELFNVPFFTVNSRIRSHGWEINKALTYKFHRMGKPFMEGVVRRVI